MIGTVLAVVGGFGASRYVSGGAEEAEAVGEQEAIMLIDKGVAHLKETTISYPNWLARNYGPGVRETTQWYLAFAAFDEAKAVLAEEPPPTTEPPTTSEPPPTTTEPPPTTTAPDTEPPSVPTNQQLGEITQTSARLAWDASTDNTGVTNYNVYLDNVRVAQPVGLEWTYVGLECGRTYLAGLTAQDAAGNVSDIAQASGSFTTAACDEPPPTTTEPPPTTTEPEPPLTTAHLWVDRNGGSCVRSPFPKAYSDGEACGSFQAAAAASSAADLARVKADSYGAQSCDGPTGGVTFVGEPGAVIHTGSAVGQAISFLGDCTIDNVDVDGSFPTVWYRGANSVWRNSTFRAAEAPRGCGSSEPIMFYDNVGTVRNAVIQNVVIETQDAGTACGGNPYHLEMIRIDQNVDGVLIDRVTFENCPDCGSGHIFITTPSTSTFKPTNIVIRNSMFKGSANYAIQTHANIGTCTNWTLAYSTFRQEPMTFGCAARSNVRFIGNVGPRPQNCISGVTYTKNVWQWAFGSPCGTDKHISGGATGYQTDRLGLNPDFTLAAGSPAIDAGETNGYCTGDLGAVDRFGDMRPKGAACDAGAHERE